MAVSNVVRQIIMIVISVLWVATTQSLVNSFGMKCGFTNLILRDQLLLEHLLEILAL